MFYDLVGVTFDEGCAVVHLALGIVFVLGFKFLAV
jgi:hypothetical protein